MLIQLRKATSATLGYQKYAIEGLARSARAADLKYHELQRTIKAASGQDHDLSHFENLSRATTFVAQSAASSSHEEGILNRSFTSTDQQVEKHDDLAPKPDSKPLIGELILCFNLVHNLLSYHLGAAANSAMYKNYLTLRRAVETAHETELEFLEKQYGDTAYVIGAEAARNALLLQKRLRELARAKHDFAEVQTRVESTVPSDLTVGKSSLAFTATILSSCSFAPGRV
jgi:hypothetical protein